MAMYRQEIRMSSPVAKERYKNWGAGAMGAFIGVGLGEYAGTYVGKVAAPASSKDQHYYSIAVKAVIGIVLLMVNTMGGLAGILLLGVAFGALGSISTDVFFLAGQGGLVGMAERAALGASNSSRRAGAAGQTFIENARQTQTNLREPQQVTTVSVSD